MVSYSATSCVGRRLGSFGPFQWTSGRHRQSAAAAAAAAATCPNRIMIKSGTHKDRSSVCLAQLPQPDSIVKAQPERGRRRLDRSGGRAGGRGRSWWYNGPTTAAAET